MCSVSNLLSFILARWDWELIWKIEEFFDRIVSRSSSIYESSCFKYLEKPLAVFLSGDENVRVDSRFHFDQIRIFRFHADL